MSWQLTVCSWQQVRLPTANCECSECSFPDVFGLILSSLAVESGTGGRQPMTWCQLKERAFGSVYFADDEVVEVDGVELFIGLLQSDGVACQRMGDEDLVAA